MSMTKMRALVYASVNISTPKLETNFKDMADCSEHMGYQACKD